MPQIQIRIGASLDRSVASVYKPLIAAARAARQQIERELNGVRIDVGSGATRGGPYRSMVTEAEKANRAIVASARRRSTEIAAIEGKEAKSASATASSFARRTSYRTIHHANAMIRGGVGVARDMARGAGVDMGLGSMVGRAVGQESQAVALANQGYMPGAQGANGQLQSARGILAGARSTAQTYARETDEVLEATSKFVGLTGDLEMARALMGDLAKLSNATGSSLSDMASAAASVSTAMDQGFTGSAADKLGATSDVMRAIAGQGKVGAVEIKDLAAQMAKLAAASGQFAGKREDLLGLVGVLAQESRKAGGSASATQAATSIMSFATSMSKPSKAQQKVMAKYGLDSYADKGKTQVKNPEEFIKEAISKTKGNLGALGGIFSTAGSMRAVRGFANVYNQAGGGTAGAAAVAKEFDDLKRATLEKAEVERANAAVLETAKAKATQFQNNIERVAASLAEQVLPQLERAAPALLSFTDSVGKMVGWAAENPFAAVTAALAVSIARAGIESTIRLGIDTAIKGAAMRLAAGSTVGVAVSAAVAKIGGPVAAAKIVGTVAVAIVAWEAGKALIDYFAKWSGDKQNASDAADIENENALGAARAEMRANGGALSEGGRENLRKAFASLGAVVGKKQLEGTSSEVDKLNLEAQLTTLNGMRALLAKIANGIPITNLEAMRPTVSLGGGRSGPFIGPPPADGWTT